MHSGYIDRILVCGQWFGRAWVVWAVSWVAMSNSRLYRWRPPEVTRGRQSMLRSWRRRTCLRLADKRCWYLLLHNLTGVFLGFAFRCFHVENVKCVVDWFIERYYVYRWESGGAQERRGVVYLRDNWAISEIPDLTRGEPVWGVLGFRERPAWIYNCVLTCVGHSGYRGWRPIREMLMYPGESRYKWLSSLSSGITALPG